MLTISIPFIKNPNSKVQVFTGRGRLSDFQILTLKKISEREDFHYFVITQFDGEEGIVYDGGKSCPICIMYYTTKGQMVSIKLGQKKILSETLTGMETQPITKDSPAYLCRIN
jgi:hypothetical protein